MAISRRLTAASMLATLVAACAWPQTPDEVPTPSAQKRTPLRTRLARFTGDFDQMLARRLDSYPVPYSARFSSGTRARSTAPRRTALTCSSNGSTKLYKLGPRPLTVTLTPASRDKLFDALLSGEGDIAAGDITITEARSARVAFTTPVLSNISEIIVTGEDVPDLDSVEALSRKEVATRRSTSYYESLIKLNERLAALSEPPVTITLVPDTLEDEDLMEMTAAGLLPAVVVDDWIAKLWSQIIKGLKLHTKAMLREGAEIAWAVRPDNPKLVENAQSPDCRCRRQYEPVVEPHQGLSRQNQTDPQRNAKCRHAALSPDAGDIREIWRRYRFDTLLLLAQGYQESSPRPRRAQPCRCYRPDAADAEDR